MTTATSPKEHAQEINAIQDKIAAKHEPKIAAVISEAWEAVARDLQTYARPDIPLDHARRVRSALVDIYRDVTRETASSMVGQFKSGFTWLECKADEDGFYERVFEEYLSFYGGSSITQITEATRRQIVSVIERGLKEGLSLDEIAAEIRQRAPEMGAIRAAVIARTETHSASMYASLASAKRSTLPLVKEWVSVEDGRTRDFGEGDGEVDAFSHRVMDEVRVALDEPFEVPMRIGGTEKLMYPGDPNGSAANIINCRCAQAYKVADEDETEDDGDQSTGTPVPVDPPTPRTRTARQRLLDRITAEQPVFRGNDGGGFDRSPELALMAIAKTPDVRGMIQDTGAYHQGSQSFPGSISMGKHQIGSEAYRRVWRHEYGHFIDDEIGKAKDGKLYASAAALRELAKDGQELLNRKSRVFMGDNKTVKAKAAVNNTATTQVVGRLIDDAIDNSLDARGLLEKAIPEVSADDILRMYDVSSVGLTDAARIAASWTERDVGLAIGDLPVNLTGRSLEHSSAFAGIQDTYEAGTAATSRAGFGHGKRYYNKRAPYQKYLGNIIKANGRNYHGAMTAQAWANWFEAYGDPNPATLALYRRLFPRTAEVFEGILMEYVNG